VEEQVEPPNSTTLQDFSFELRNTLSCALGIINLMEGEEKLEKYNQYYISLLKDSFDGLLKKIEEYVFDTSKISFKNSEVPDFCFKDLRFKDARVLLVDDNEINNYVMKQLFNKLGIEVDIAYFGKEAINLYQNNDYDIVFMDYIMPEMNGLETVKHIRSMGDRGKNQLIVALSANIQIATKENFNKLGVELFIYKPVELDQLCYILYRELASKII
jgi:CheY-like chemotaxis protein